MSQNMSFGYFLSWPNMKHRQNQFGNINRRCQEVRIRFGPKHVLNVELLSKAHSSQSFYIYVKCITDIGGCLLVNCSCNDI